MERIYSQRLSNRFGSGNLLPNITTSLGYQQADIRGRRRMESLFNMGLPLQSDINRVRLERVDQNGMRIYSAAPHQPWGTWGALSGLTAKDGTPVSTGKFSKPLTPPTPRRQPIMETPEGYIRNRYGYLEKDYSKEGYEKDRYGYWQKKDVPKFPSK